MALDNWKKIENEVGYPCYIDETTGKQQYDHPQFQKIIQSLEEYDEIKYSVYRVAYKICALQKFLRVPPLRISSGVFARHQLSMSETSLSLDTAELEAVLADIYFAAEKEGLFTGDVDLTVDLLINLLLNVYDKDRTEPVRVLAAKTLMIVLSEDTALDKWAALANCSADHNGCVSPRRLTALLTHVTALPVYLGCPYDNIQADVDACFDKSAGMLGVSARCVGEWGAARCGGARWLPLLQCLARARPPAQPGGACALCAQPLTQVLKFKCSKCNNVNFCEKCYLYDKDLTAVSGHKKTHLVQEVLDSDIKPAECLSFMRGMRRFFFCTRTKKKKMTKKSSKKSVDKVENHGTLRRRKDGKPAIFTSTVGKASGNGVNNPTSVLQDIINNLEANNCALQELVTHLESVSKDTEENGLKTKVNMHRTQISTQISRLKVLKETLSSSSNPKPLEPQPDKLERPQAFDLFSPIPVDEPQSKAARTQPRVLSLDSGNFSTSPRVDTELLTASGDALKPIVVHATSDTVSTMSMNDISHWYNEQESLATKPPPGPEGTNQSISATERKYLADIRSVASGNDKVRTLSADLDSVLDRLHQILANNFAMDDSCFDNSQLRETANEMEGLLGSLIRGVEQRATLGAKGLV